HPSRQRVLIRTATVRQRPGPSLFRGSTRPVIGESNMAGSISVGGLKVDQSPYDLVRDEIAPGKGGDPHGFWASLGAVVRELGSKNQQLLERRLALQAKIDEWHRQHRGTPLDVAAEETFLRKIGYLVPEGEDFRITTVHVDPELAEVAGPQLVVPVDNARYALNAANARWGSLYDALYGTEVIPEDNGAERRGEYNPTRGARVIAAATAFLDRHVGL